MSERYVLTPDDVDYGQGLIYGLLGTKYTSAVTEFYGDAATPTVSFSFTVGWSEGNAVQLDAGRQDSPDVEPGEPF